jgi:hypothetical protein
MTTVQRDISYKIPVDLFKQFEAEARIVLGPIPGIYPIDPGVLIKMKPEVLQEVLKQHQLVLVPRA